MPTPKFTTADEIRSSLDAIIQSGEHIQKIKDIFVKHFLTQAEADGPVNNVLIKLMSASVSYLWVWPVAKAGTLSYEGSDRDPHNFVSGLVAVYNDSKLDVDDRRALAPLLKELKSEFALPNPVRFPGVSDEAKDYWSRMAGELSKVNLTQIT